MKYFAYFGSSTLVIAALFGYIALADGERLFGRELTQAAGQPTAKAISKSCKRGVKGTDQISAEALMLSL